jgi:hypothetical protein
MKPFRPSRISRLLPLTAALLLAGCGVSECPKQGWVPDRCAPVGEFPYGDNGERLYIPNTGEDRYLWWGNGLSYDKEHRIASTGLLAFDRLTLQPVHNARQRYPLAISDTAVVFHLTATARATQRGPTLPRRTTRQLIQSAKTSPEPPPIPAPSGFEYIASSLPRQKTGYTLWFLGPPSGPRGVETVLTCNWVSQRLTGTPVNKVETCELTFERPEGFVVHATFNVPDRERIPYEETYAAVNALLDRWKVRPQIPAEPNSCATVSH